MICCLIFLLVGGLVAYISGFGFLFFFFGVGGRAGQGRAWHGIWDALEIIVEEKYGEG